MKKKFYNKISKEFIDRFYAKVNSAGSIVVTSHLSPDDDAIASVLAMYFLLVEELKISKGKVKMIYTGAKEVRWGYFKSFNDIMFVDDLVNHVGKKDLLIMVDGSGWKRFSKKENMKQFSGDTICVDHHPTPDNKFNLHTVAVNYSSTSEIIYRMFFEDKKIGKPICEILLLGILGDTGNFKFVTPQVAGTFDVAKALVVSGNIKIEELVSNYSYLTKGQLYLIGKLIENSKISKVKNWGQFMYTFLDAKQLSGSKYSNIDVEGASGIFAYRFLKSVKSVDWGFVVTPQDANVSKISFRSTPNSVSVRNLVERMKIGGGHDRAAGGAIEDSSPKKTTRAILSWIKNNKPLII